MQQQCGNEVLGQQHQKVTDQTEFMAFSIRFQSLFTNPVAYTIHYLPI